MLTRALLLLVCFAALSGARVVRLESVERRPVLDGREWGLAGAYETVKAKAHFAVDPSNPANQIITDIDRAPRNADGEVEYSADIYLIKPVDLGRGNRTVLLEINNRGRKGMLGMFNRAEGSLDPISPEHFGDGLLLEQGYTLLWVGWQFDPPRDADKMFVYPPVAKGPGGAPIRGLARADFVVTDREYSHSLADRDHVPYPVADPGAAENVLTVRDRVEADRTVIPRKRWRFGRMENGKVVEDAGRVWLEGGFEPGKIYEVVYVAEDPPLVGLGPAAVRDFVSHLKHESNEALGVEPAAIEHAIGFGISQSGRFLRTFLYYGFNGDERERRVFDGVLSHVAGGGRGSFNHRFAQPSRDAHPFLNFFYPTDIFPFSDVRQKDPASGLEMGLLDFYDGHEELRPKVFYTNSSYEYWGRAASLIHTSIDGKRDIAVPERTRIYHIAGTQHGPGSFPPQVSIGQQPSNAVDYRWAMRGLLESLRGWAAEGRKPPASQYGKVADGTMVPPEKLAWPAIPGVGFSTRIHKAYRADYGPRFYSEGIVDQEPPKIGPAFAVLAPAVNEDGNETTGIRLPEVAVPLATHTGWNLFNDKSGPTDEISSMQGSFVAFPRTKAERKAKGDPRLSIEERYTSRAEYVGRVAEVALELSEQGYILDADVPAIVRSAGEKWDALTSR